MMILPLKTAFILKGVGVSAQLYWQRKSVVLPPNRDMTSDNLPISAVRLTSTGAAWEWHSPLAPYLPKVALRLNWVMMKWNLVSAFTGNRDANEYPSNQRMKSRRCWRFLSLKTRTTTALCVSGMQTKENG